MNKEDYLKIRLKQVLILILFALSFNKIKTPVMCSQSNLNNKNAYYLSQKDIKYKEIERKVEDLKKQNKIDEEILQHINENHKEKNPAVKEQLIKTINYHKKAIDQELEKMKKFNKNNNKFSYIPSKENLTLLFKNLNGANIEKLENDILKLKGKNNLEKILTAKERYKIPIKFSEKEKIKMENYITPNKNSKEENLNKNLDKNNNDNKKLEKINKNNEKNLNKNLNKNNNDNKKLEKINENNEKNLNKKEEKKNENFIKNSLKNKRKNTSENFKNNSKLKEMELEIEKTEEIKENSYMEKSNYGKNKILPYIQIFNRNKNDKKKSISKVNKHKNYM